MKSKLSRDQHKHEVISFLQKRLANQKWEIELPPHGTGQETYFVNHADQSYFIKLGAKAERYQVMSQLGLSPTLIAVGQLEDGISILVQQRISGRKPTRQDFRQHWRKFAENIRETHQSESLKRVLPKRSSQKHKDVGLEILGEIEARWQLYKAKVPAWTNYVEQSVQYLEQQVGQFNESGLVASHNDICNGNWLVTPDENVYLLDYEAMSLDDPAVDLGAILWWYYPPEMHPAFLEVVGYRHDEEFRNRMRIRMAIHNFNISIPRQDSFDQFSAETFDEALVDFRAVLAGRANPQGYYD